MSDFFATTAPTALTLYRRQQSETIASSFLVQKQDQFGGQVYNRSNQTIASMSTLLGASAIASGNRSTAIGAYAYAKEDSATAVGIYAQAWGQSSIAIGDQAKATGYRTISLGASSSGLALRSIAIGVGAVASGQDSIAIGTAAKATGQNSVALGNSSTASGLNSAALGMSSTASGIAATAVGQLASATGDSSTSIGKSSQATATSATAIGQSTSASAANATAVGIGASVSASEGSALGSSSSVAGVGGTALGTSTSVSAAGTRGIALGYASQSLHANSVAIGNTVVTTTGNQCLIGDATNVLNLAVGGPVTLLGGDEVRLFSSITRTAVHSTSGAWAINTNTIVPSGMRIGPAYGGDFDVNNDDSDVAITANAADQLIGLLAISGGQFMPLMGNYVGSSASFNRWRIGQQLSNWNDFGQRIYQDSGVTGPAQYLVPSSAGTNPLFIIRDSGDTANVFTILQNGKVQTTTDVQLTSAGAGFYVKEGTNATMGVLTLSGAVATAIAYTTKVTASSRIMVTTQNTGANIGSVGIVARTAGTSFTVGSSNILDTRDVAWVIFEPAP